MKATRLISAPVAAVKTSLVICAIGLGPIGASVAMAHAMPEVLLPMVPAPPKAASPKAAATKAEATKASLARTKAQISPNPVGQIRFVDITRPSNAPRAAAMRFAVAAPPKAAQGRGDASLPPYLQCVPYARMVSGVQLRGDAHTWWKQAAGRYARGFTPKVGAVMAFQPHGAMVLGHVAAVSKLVDKRTILLRHANWSPIKGRRGQIEDNVRAVDVSARNDWSEVRVWFDPAKGLGSTHWPVSGFIYNRPAAHSENGTTRKSWSADPIGAIIAAFSRD